jgi:hypothetical protein
MHFTEPPPFLWNSETSTLMTEAPSDSTVDSRVAEMPSGMTR